MRTKNHWLFPFIMMFMHIGSNAQEIKSALSLSKTYFVNKVEDESFDYDKDPDNLWSLANILSDFSYPWREENSNLTLFRALHDNRFFYFRYDVVDPKIYTDKKTGNETDVMNSDRVEIFFLANKKMNPYYCLEMDAEGNLFDYLAKYYRQNNFEWNWPTDHIELKAFKKRNGYGISGKINLEYLRKIQALQADSMYLGLFRADINEYEDGKPVFKWISWIEPNAEEPDFHIPSAFGRFVMSQ